MKSFLYANQLKIKVEFLKKKKKTNARKHGEKNKI